MGLHNHAELVHRNSHKCSNFFHYMNGRLRYYCSLMQFTVLYYPRIHIESGSTRPSAMPIYSYIRTNILYSKSITQLLETYDRVVLITTIRTKNSTKRRSTTYMHSIHPADDVKATFLKHYRTKVQGLKLYFGQ